MSAFASYVAAHRAGREQAERDRVLLQAQARHAAREAAVRVAERAGATQVLLFGSLARGTFNERSDIDLAVSGLQTGKLVDALAAAEDGCPFRVDILPLEHARAEIRASILEYAEVLWPR